jgi:hypothetical protein
MIDTEIELQMETNCFEMTLIVLGGWGFGSRGVNMKYEVILVRESETKIGNKDTPLRLSMANSKIPISQFQIGLVRTAFSCRTMAMIFRLKNCG